MLKPCNAAFFYTFYVCIESIDALYIVVLAHTPVLYTCTKTYALSRQPICNPFFPIRSGSSANTTALQSNSNSSCLSSAYCCSTCVARSGRDRERETGICRCWILGCDIQLIFPCTPGMSSLMMTMFTMSERRPGACPTATLYNIAEALSMRPKSFDTPILMMRPSRWLVRCQDRVRDE